MKNKKLFLSSAAFSLLVQFSVASYAISTSITFGPATWEEREQRALCYEPNNDEKEIKIHVKQTQETDTSPIKIDVSGSTVPSGQAEFLWDYEKSTNPVLTVSDAEPGAYRTRALTIRDKVCGFSHGFSVGVESK